MGLLFFDGPSMVHTGLECACRKMRLRSAVVGAGPALHVPSKFLWGGVCEHCIFGAASFSRASFLRLFVGGQLLRRAHLFSRWFSGWPFSSQLLISDFHLAPALLGSAAGTPERRSIFGLHACI